MSVTNNTISGPTSPSEVSRLIGAGSDDIGMVCRSPMINPYSKYKPMHIASFEPTDAERREANWGYEIPDIAVNPQALFNFVVNGVKPSGYVDHSGDSNYVPLHNGWWYRKPTGGADSPYNIGDFRGYKHDVTRQLVVFDSLSVIDLSEPLGSYQFSVASEDSAHQYTISDMPVSYTTSHQFGIMVMKSASSKAAFCIARNSVASQNYIQLTAEQAKELFYDGNGEYYVIPVLTTMGGNESQDTNGEVVVQDHAQGAWRSLIPMPNRYAVVTVVGYSTSGGDSGNTPYYGIYITNAQVLQGARLYFSYEFGCAETFTSSFAQTITYEIYVIHESGGRDSLTSGTFTMARGQTTSERTYQRTYPVSSGDRFFVSAGVSGAMETAEFEQL